MLETKLSKAFLLSATLSASVSIVDFSSSAQEPATKNIVTAAKSTASTPSPAYLAQTIFQLVWSGHKGRSVIPYDYHHDELARYHFCNPYPPCSVALVQVEDKQYVVTAIEDARLGVVHPDGSTTPVRRLAISACRPSRKKIKAGHPCVYQADYNDFYDYDIDGHCDALREVRAGTELDNYFDLQDADNQREQSKKIKKVQQEYQRVLREIARRYGLMK